MRTFISINPMKQWCNARGLDLATHMQGFPLAALRMQLPRAKVIRLSFFKSIKQAIKNFFKY